jgi:oxygen-independent coproporphyrinogen-3 oxidase
MFGIPGQTLEVWRKTLREALSLGSEHLSSYEVIYEEDTALYQQMKARQFEVDEDLNCAMYDALVEHAEQGGFMQYEVANFARRQTGPDRPERWQNSYACRHNVNYWRGGEFHAVGPSATAYVGGVRSKNWANTAKYCELLESGVNAVESTETLAPAARAGELAAFGLRMVDGWPFEEFQERTGKNLQRDWPEALFELVRQGWGSIEPDRVRLTPLGLRFADSAAQLFL